LKIEVIGLTKDFGSGEKTLHALKDVNFVIEPGEVFGFVGANGAGKSTTMRIIMGVLSSTSGRVLLDSQEASRNLRQQIGYMPSERGLYPKMKVLDQLVFFAKLHGLTKQDAAQESKKWITKLNIEQYADKVLSTLSTGNQQRVQLAVSLISRPKALVLDEPFSGLDPLAVKVMSDVIREQAANGVAVLFSSHQLELVDQLSDKVGIISQGEIVVNGTPAELRQKANAPETITVPTPLANIFGDLISSDETKGEGNV
jgi:ABC-2 type transport system ATP-binding protein